MTKQPDAAGRARRRWQARAVTRRAAAGLISDRAAYLAAAAAVAEAMALPLDDFAFPGRRICGRFCPPPRKLAHELTLYLTVTAFDVSQSRIARALGLWRTSVSPALARIEDRRDAFEFDRLVTRLENRLAGV